MNHIGQMDGLHEQAAELASLTRDLARCCLAKEEQIFGRFGLPVTAGRVLLAAAETGSSSPSELADKLSLGRSRLTPLVELLVKKGLVQRAESQDDRRVRDLTLTEAGAKVAQEVTDFHLAFHETLLQRYDATERERLLSVLKNFHTIIEEVRGEMGLPLTSNTTSHEKQMEAHADL
jgi:DNA-binding MarR family transcriptional regulator